MYATRLGLLQVDLRSHQKWLRTFVSITKSACIREHVSPTGLPYLRYRGTKAHQIQQIRFKSKTRNGSEKRHLARPPNFEKTERHLRLRNAISAYDIVTLDASYNDLPNKQGLSNQIPREQRRLEDTEQIITFTEQLIRDVKARKLVPAPAAYMHILGALKEAGAQDIGVKFWQWLEVQEDEYLGHDVYAAAIELLAAGGTALSSIEELYKTCLERFPGAFLAYHLSPNAIVPDREAETADRDIPLVLLQAITTARLARGDTRGAYLALDTALRLSPSSIPPRLFGLFMDQRPVLEAFTVFAMACRSGQPVGSGLFRRFLAALRQLSKVDSIPMHISAIRAMIAAMYLHLGAGAPVKSNSVSELAIALNQILRLPGIEKLPVEQRQQAVNGVLSVEKRVFEMFARYGAMPNTSAFNSIIANLAGYGHSKGVLTTAMADMQAIGLQPNAATYRSVLTAGGLLHDKDLIKKTWDELVGAKTMEGSELEEIDFIVLAKAATVADLSAFAQQQIDKLGLDLSSTFRSAIKQSLDNPPPKGPSENQDSCMSADHLFASLQRLAADMDVFNEQTMDSPSLLDFGARLPPSQLLTCPEKLCVEEATMKALYDELTSERRTSGVVKSSDKGQSESLPRSASLAAPSPGSAVSSTNVTYGVLRYENWKDVNYLLYLAEQHDRQHSGSIAGPIAASQQPRERHRSLSFVEQRHMQNTGLSGLEAHDLGAVSNPLQKIADALDARTEVTRLRGYTPAS